MTTTVRASQEADITAITAIYAHHVLHGTGTFEIDPPGSADIAHAEGRIVAGTGNASEAYVGYFTKWGDGAHDFNPIADLTVTEIYEFLRYLDAPACIIEKAPSAGLFDGQTDEADMGLKYADLDEYILTGHTNEKAAATIERLHRNSRHKRDGIARFSR